MGLAWLNACGGLDFLQSGRMRARSLGAAWLVFAAALLLPSAKGCGSSNIYGWQAAVFCARAQVRLVAAASESPRDVWGDASTNQQLALLLLLNTANVGLLFAPVFLWQWEGGAGRVFQAVLPLTATGVWSLSWNDGELLAGYYVWCAATIILVAACRIRWPALVVMLLLLIVLCAGPP
jgi:hypothetical protein